MVFEISLAQLIKTNDRDFQESYIEIIPAKNSLNLVLENLILQQGLGYVGRDRML